MIYKKPRQPFVVVAIKGNQQAGVVTQRHTRHMMSSLQLPPRVWAFDTSPCSTRNGQTSNINKTYGISSETSCFVLNSRSPSTRLKMI